MLDGATLAPNGGAESDPLIFSSTHTVMRRSEVGKRVALPKFEKLTCPSSHDYGLQVFVVGGPKHLTIHDIENDWTTSMLKYELCARFKMAGFRVTEEDFYLMCAGKVMRDHLTLSEQNIYHNARIEFLGRLLGGMEENKHESCEAYEECMCKATADERNQREQKVTPTNEHKYGGGGEMTCEEIKAAVEAFNKLERIEHWNKEAEAAFTNIFNSTQHAGSGNAQNEAQAEHAQQKTAANERRRKCKPPKRQRQNPSKRQQQKETAKRQRIEALVDQSLRKLRAQREKAPISDIKCRAINNPSADSQEKSCWWQAWGWILTMLALCAGGCVKGWKHTHDMLTSKPVTTACPASADQKHAWDNTRSPLSNEQEEQFILWRHAHAASIKDGWRYRHHGTHRRKWSAKRTAASKQREANQRRKRRVWHREERKLACEEANMMRGAEGANAEIKKSKSRTVLIDSGASSNYLHANDAGEYAYSDRVRTDESITVSSADTDSMPLRALGRIDATGNLDNGVNMRLYNTVLLDSRLRQPLLSIGEQTKHGYTFLFKGSECYVFRNQKLIKIVPRVDNLYEIEYTGTARGKTTIETGQVAASMGVSEE